MQFFRVVYQFVHLIKILAIIDNDVICVYNTWSINYNIKFGIILINKGTKLSQHLVSPLQCHEDAALCHWIKTTEGDALL